MVRLIGICVGKLAGTLCVSNVIVRMSADGSGAVGDGVRCG